VLSCKCLEYQENNPAQYAEYQQSLKFKQHELWELFLFFIEFEWIKVHVGDKKKLFK